MKATLRFKKRYLAFRIAGPDMDALSESEVRDCVYESLLSFFGELGFSTLSFKLIRYNHKRKIGIMRCERGRMPLLQAAVALVNDLGGKRARIMGIRTSGTILSLKEKGI